MKAAPYERFIAKITPEPMSGCWLWTASTTPFGYGKFWDGERLEMAHRHSYRVSKGEPGALNVCHDCDNPACVNPAHLFLGTDKDNMQDSLRKGRHFAPRGAANSAVPTEVARAIRATAGRRAGHGEIKALALQYGLSECGVHRIRTGLRWKEL